VRRPRFERLIAKYPLHAVSRRNRAAEVSPGDVGLSQRTVDTIWRAAERLYETRLYPALGLSVRRRGKVLIDGTIGHTRGNSPDDSPDTPKVVATPDTRFNLFSASKAITAMVIHRLDDRGLLQVDDRVAEYIPEFAQQGKDWITLKHVLTHRAGIPSVPAEYASVDMLADWDNMIRLLSEAKPTALPGRRLAYHALTGGFVLGEVVKRVTGRDIKTVLRDDILGPIGIEDMSYGVPEDELDQVAENAFTGPPSMPPFSWAMKRSLGIDVPEATELSNHPLFLTSVVPSGNVICTADQCTRFFQMLLNEGELDGVRVFEPRTVRRAVADTTSFMEFDLTLCMPVRYGMGFMLGARRLTVYGQNTTKAYGHLGFTGVVCYACPERDISVALMTTGKPFIHRGIPRWFGLLNSIARLIPRDGKRSRA